MSREEQLSGNDPALGPVIAVVTERIGAQRIKPSKAPPFEALVRAVVYQSVSGKAAATIFARLRASMGGRLHAAEVLKKPPASLASAGLSGSKARAICGLASWFCENPALARRITTLPDEGIIDALTGIPGIGLWTANVFLIFSLARPDVIPAGDMGIRRGVQLVRNLPQPASAKQAQEQAALWQPYRSIASIYLWNAVKINLTQSDLKNGKRP
jgi:DNA-3-methyladenine glycosylase II